MAASSNFDHQFPRTEMWKPVADFSVFARFRWKTHLYDLFRNESRRGLPKRPNTPETTQHNRNRLAGLFAFEYNVVLNTGLLVAFPSWCTLLSLLTFTHTHITTHAHNIGYMSGNLLLTCCWLRFGNDDDNVRTANMHTRAVYGTTERCLAHTH